MPEAPKNPERLDFYSDKEAVGKAMGKAVYDALRTARPYKTALAHQQAASTMRAESRSGLWDEELVMELFTMLENRQRVA